MNHFTRLIDLTSADEEYISKLATVLAPCILRPRAETSLTMEEKHAYRLVRDLFAHKDAIFNELKRLSTMNSSGSIKGNQNRPRAISTDESNRKAHMEERNRALLEKASGSRSRATSPAPSPRAAHRRDRSIGGPETRFPIQTNLSSPTSESRKQRGSLGPVLPKRTSLEVPGEESSGGGGSMGLSHPADGNFIMNGAPPIVGEPAPAAAAAAQGGGGGASVLEKRNSLGRRIAGEQPEGMVEKRNSLGRSGARFSSGRRVTPASSSSAAAAAARTSTPPPAGQQGQQGVTLVDAPMDY